MSGGRETTLTLFMMYLSPLTPRCPRFTFWLTVFQSCMLPLFFSRLLSYLVGMKRTTSRCATCKKDNYHFVHYVLISPDVLRFTFWLTFFKVIHHLYS